MAGQSTPESAVQQKNHFKTRLPFVAEQSSDALALSRRPAESVGTEANEERHSLSVLMRDLEGALAGDPVQSQAVHLKGTRFQTVQRQAIAIQIGRLQGNRHLQRVIQWPVAVQREVDAPPTMAPSTEATRETLRAFSYRQAATIAAYVGLVQALERAYSGLSSRQILAMLRQVYYGRPWSIRPTAQWQDVLPSSPAMPDPRSRIMSGPGSLFEALQQSQEVGGTDIGHVLTGLEALLNPTREVEIEIPGPNVTVAMPNTEFATWGGDLGSAAGQAVVDRDLGRPASTDQAYFVDLASDVDLEGDIDAFGIAQGAARSGGLEAMFTIRPTGSTAGMPVSRILREYYLAPGSTLGSAHTNRYRDFVARIGGTISDNRITNRAAMVRPITTRVASFAEVWYLKEYKNARGTLLGAARAAEIRSGMRPDIITWLRIKSMIMTVLFFNWLQTRLSRS